jgi:hypothetical protein
LKKPNTFKFLITISLIIFIGFIITILAIFPKIVKNKQDKIDSNTEITTLETTETTDNTTTTLLSTKDTTLENTNNTTLIETTADNTITIICDETVLDTTTIVFDTETNNTTTEGTDKLTTKKSKETDKTTTTTVAENTTVDETTIICELNETTKESNKNDLSFVKTFNRGTFYCYGCEKTGGSGRKLISCAVGDGFAKGSIASSYLFLNYGYYFNNNSRTTVYLEINGYPKMNGYYYVDDSDAGNSEVIDFFYINESECPFNKQGVVAVNCYI